MVGRGGSHKGGAWNAHYGQEWLISGTIRGQIASSCVFHADKIPPRARGSGWHLASHMFEGTKEETDRGWDFGVLKVRAPHDGPRDRLDGCARSAGWRACRHFKPQANQSEVGKPHSTRANQPQFLVSFQRSFHCSCLREFKGQEALTRQVLSRGVSVFSCSKKRSASFSTCSFGWPAYFQDCLLLGGWDVSL